MNNWHLFLRMLWFTSVRLFNLFVLFYSDVYVRILDHNCQVEIILKKKKSIFNIYSHIFDSFSIWISFSIGIHTTIFSIFPRFSLSLSLHFLISCRRNVVFHWTHSINSSATAFLRIQVLPIFLYCYNLNQKKICEHTLWFDQ